MRILVTRPEPDSARLAECLRGRGHEPVLAPVLAIEPLADAAIGPGPWAAILATSANALRAMAGHPRLGEFLALPLLAVGTGTAVAAREAGFIRVESADGDGGDLAALVAARFRGGGACLLYLAGEARARDLAGALAAEGLAVETVAVYRAVALERFPPMVQEALAQGTIGAVTHFSRRSAEAYLRCVASLGEAGLRPHHFCISEAAAAPLRAARAGQTSQMAQVTVAGRPDEAALLELIGHGA